MIPAQRPSPEDITPSSNMSDMRPASADSACRETPYDDKVDSENQAAQPSPNTGVLASWRGIMIMLVTCGGQLIDNVFLTGVNIAIPAIQKDFHANNADLQWLLSAYTLTFGGFMLLAGVLSDRYGRKNIFCLGMVWFGIWTLINGFAQSFMQLAIFRAVQGIGAALTVPAGVGIVSAFFEGRDRTKALTLFGGAGGAGFCVGLLLGGFLTSALGWRYLFYLSVILTGVLAIVGWIVLPQDQSDNNPAPKLDILGSVVSTAGLVLLSFVLASGGQYGWSTPFIIALLILSIILLVAFVFIETKVPNPIMPLSIWRYPNFAGLWLVGFWTYGSYMALLYYALLTSQNVMHLSTGATALRFIPMGCLGTSLVISMGHLLDRLNKRMMLYAGLICLTVAPIPCALITADSKSFWTHVLPTSLIGIVGVATSYATVTVVLLASVPVSAKSLCGGMINTGFQIGSGFALALASAVVQSVEIDHGHGILEQYRVGLYCSAGMGGLAILCCLVGVRHVHIERTEK